MTMSLIYIIFLRVCKQLAEGKDYPEYTDEVGVSEQVSREMNNVNSKSKEAAYFRVESYIEKAKVGDTVRLKCDVKNAGRKSTHKNTLTQFGK